MLARGLTLRNYMLKIKNLHAKVNEKTILKGLNLNVKPGELHAIMGRNASGKSTLAHVLAGRDIYNITKGEVSFDGQDLLDMEPEDRALSGFFIGFQYPVALAGVNLTYFLKAALNAKRKYQKLEELDAVDFLSYIKEKMEMVGMNESYLSRSVNEGFSGGEKKRNEILQLLTLEPKLAILDETDSGLDIDALKVVSNGINLYRNSKRSVVIITHYQRILNYLEPDFVHVMIDGKIVKSGTSELANRLEKDGYDWVEKEINI